jgi:hypothetical protein
VEIENPLASKAQRPLASDAEGVEISRNSVIEINTFCSQEVKVTYLEYVNTTRK